MENISCHRWATTIVINCLCRASNSRGQTKPMPNEPIYIKLGSEEGKRRKRINKQLPCRYGGLMGRKTPESRAYLSSKHSRGSL